jgi:hypothetical protein
MWIDVDGNAVLRNTLASGQKHSEMTSIDHVWAIIATPSESNTICMSSSAKAATPVRGLSRQLRKAQSMRTARMRDAVPDDEQLERLKEPHAFIFRPSKGSLQDEKCTHIMWIPHNSVTVLQRPHNLYPPPHKVIPGRHTTEALQLNLHIQVLYSDTAIVGPPASSSGKNDI